MVIAVIDGSVVKVGAFVDQCIDAEADANQHNDGGSNKTEGLAKAVRPRQGAQVNRHTAASNHAVLLDAHQLVGLNLHTVNRCAVLTVVHDIHLAVATMLHRGVIAAHRGTRQLNVVVKVAADAVYALEGRVIFRHRHLAPLQLNVGKTDGIAAAHVHGLVGLNGLVHDEGAVVAALIFEQDVAVV